MGGNAEAFVTVSDAVARGDEDAVVELSHPEVVAETLRSAVQGAWQGHDGVRAWMRDTAAHFEVFELDYATIEELPDGRVLAIGTVHVRVAGAGIELDVPTAALVEFRDGLMYRYKDHGDADLARAAVG